MRGTSFAESFVVNAPRAEENRGGVGEGDHQIIQPWLSHQRMMGSAFAWYELRYSPPPLSGTEGEFEAEDVGVELWSGLSTNNGKRFCQVRAAQNHTLKGIEWEFQGERVSGPSSD